VQAAPGLRGTLNTVLSELAAALDKRTNSQSEVNAVYYWSEIAVFFRPPDERHPEKCRRSGTPSLI